MARPLQRNSVPLTGAVNIRVCRIPSSRLIFDAISIRAACNNPSKVNTSLDKAERRRIEIDDRRWAACATPGRDLKMMMLELVGDWGLFLEVSLDQRAIVHMLGGKDRVEARDSGILIAGPRRSVPNDCVHEGSNRSRNTPEPTAVSLSTSCAALD